MRKNPKQPKRLQLSRPGAGAQSRAAPPFWHVYMLRCGDGSLYTGATNDLAGRVTRHQLGRGAAYTRSHRPVRLVFFERAADRSQALRREAQIKRLARAAKLALVKTGGAT